MGAYVEDDMPKGKKVDLHTLKVQGACIERTGEAVTNSGDVQTSQAAGEKITHCKSQNPPTYKPGR